MTTSPYPARVAAPQKSRPRSPEAHDGEQGNDSETGAREAPPQKGTTDERARILQEYSALQRGLAPPVKRQRRVAKVDAMSQPVVATDGSAQDEEEQASTAASTPAGSVVTSASIEIIPVKENVAVAVVAQEEKRLDGAPEGELFIVNVLSREEFQPSTSLDEETRELDDLLTLLEDAKQASGGSSNGDDGDVSWGKQYAAVDAVRRLAIHHSHEAQSRL